jgi:hypothetical protein
MLSSDSLGRTEENDKKYLFSQDSKSPAEI